MEQLHRLYLSLINNTTLVMVITGVLFVAGIVVSGLQDQIFVSGDLQAIVLEGNLLYGLFLSTSGILVYAGWRFDNQPGRSIVVALIAIFVGGIINMLFSTAVAGEWLPIWFGVLLGAWSMVLYGAWRIQARFAMIVLAMVVYVILVTAGFMIGIGPELSAPIALGILAVGGLAFVFAATICERILAAIVTRRDAPEQSIRDGARDSLRMVLLWGIIAIALAAPAAITGTEIFRTLGLLFLIGSVVSIYAALALPATLLLVKGGSGVRQSEGPRTGKRRR